VLLERFVPELQAQGFSDAEVKQLLVTNPAAAFAVRLRLG
jgi:predicted metal-dependent phosphotriesterase family hydrolase